MREKCNNCAHPSKACIPYLMTLSTRGMLEWCRIWKERLGWSNSSLAAKSGIPKGTIDRILSHVKDADDATDVKFITVRQIVCTLVGCTVEELEACEVVSITANAETAEKNRLLTEQLVGAKGVIALYRDQNAIYKKQIAAQSKQIKEYEKKIATLEKQVKAL